MDKVKWLLLLIAFVFSGEINPSFAFPTLPISADGTEDLDNHKGIIRFQVSIDVQPSNTNEGDLTISDTETIYLDWGVLILPKQYSNNGISTRLVIVCHGAGGTVTGNGSQIEDFPLTKYLVSEGFAVMDMAGLPEHFAEKFSINLFNNMGSGIAIQSYIKGYHWVIENYNIKQDGAHLWGGSMGGLTSNNLLYSGQIPILSQSAACPVTDLYNQAWLKPWSKNAPKVAIAKLFSFKNADRYEPEKVVGFNPILNNSWFIDGLRYKIHGVPLKIWHADEDPIVTYQGSADFVDAIKRAGGRAELRTLRAKSHEPMDLGETVKFIVYNDEKVPISPVVEEMFLWIKQFE